MASLRNLMNLVSRSGRTISLCGLKGPFYLSVRKKGGKVKLPAEPKEKLWIKKTKRIVVPLTKEEKKQQEEIAKRVLTDDVWIARHYAPRHYTALEAITMHQELASPEMTHNLDGLLVFSVHLDMSTNKKTKFLSEVKGTVVLPYPCIDGVENKVIVFCATEEEQSIAEEMGAYAAGSDELIKAIESSEIHSDDYDHVVCTDEMQDEILRIKKYFKDRFPNKAKGTVSNDVRSLVRQFAQGKTFCSVKDSDSTATLTVNIGQIKLPAEQLLENFKAYVESFWEQRKQTLSSPFITSGSLTCSPSKECFLLMKEDLFSKSVVMKKSKTMEKDDVDVDVAKDDDDDDDEKVDDKDVKRKDIV